MGKETISVITDLLIAGVAGWQVVETWHHGSIFDSWRRKLKKRKSESKSIAGRKFSELLICPFCLSHWVCFFCIFLLMQTDPESLWRLPVYGFAATRVAQLLSDVTHSITLSPDSSEETVIDETDDVEKRYRIVDDTEKR